MSQSAITEKRTVVTTSSSNYSNDEPIKYKSSVGPRSTSSTTVKSRSSFTPSISVGRPTSGYSYQATYSYGLGSAPPIAMQDGSYARLSSSNVTNVKEHRAKEKKDMQDLNERLANYIEKVRFLEAQNKKLAAELEDLKSKWGKETAAIKSMYETELKEVREVLDDTAKEKSRLEIEVRNLQEINHDLRLQ